LAGEDILGEVDFQKDFPSIRIIFGAGKTKPSTARININNNI
jgi:hypothetical protein